ncbi:hypothetical protein [Paraburkholderia susongensis]|uniref:Uncharacterized protein n=1 Tax=Paraburkholderia susongensis TaxID=1515439 RepID=A0A1X7LT34_9BURK|nr:hypothetical protein [Paraburkholderia susongensis]SMG57048.1 hypothetical protein SAMN06265784_10958 [Paraburkholderia susongensis]
MNIRHDPLLKLSVMALGFACAVFASGYATAQSGDAAQKAASAQVQLAANYARLAVDVCGADPKSVEAYKTSVGKQFQDQNFAADWATGWNTHKFVTDFQGMKAHLSAADYEQQKADTCQNAQDQMKP